MKKAIVLGVVILVLVGGCGYWRGTYNGFVEKEENVTTSWAQVENQLQRRFDLVPNLVETVKGYAAHEREVLTEVTEARARVGGASSVPEQIEANNALSSALSRLLLVVERYPDLKANQNFLALQDELAGTENRIAVERRRYNESVRDYNVALRKFPANIIAGIHSFERAAVFEATDAAEETPRVDFGTREE